MSKQGIGLFALSGAALMGYFYYEKQKLQQEREETKDESYGKPKVGGPFSLVDHDGIPVSNLDYQGKFMLLYFGYTFCPDVCPEELEKMAIMYDILAKEKVAETLAPIFISCDAKRDSVESIKGYVKEFHPKFIGLTGTHTQILKMAKAYRLYFSAPPKALDDDESDYLVDHSIFFYLMGPDGKFLAHYGRNETAEEIAGKILAEMNLEKLKQPVEAAV